MWWSTKPGPSHVTGRTVPGAGRGPGRRVPCRAVAAPDAVDVRRLRRAAFVAGLGDGVAAVALPLLAASLTRDPLSVAGVVAAQHLPWPLLVLALPALRGTDRRTLAGAGDSLRAVAVAAAGLLTVVGDETIITLLLVAFALGVGQALRDDAERVGGETRQDRAGDPAAAAIVGAGMVGLAAFGLPLGGVLYELLAPVPLLFDVGVFSVAALLVLAVRSPLRAGRGDGEDDAARFPRPAEGAGAVTAAAAVASLAAGAVAGVLVLVALDDLGFGAPAFGFLLAGLAASSAVGGLLAPAVGQAVGVRVGAVLGLAAAAAGQAAAWALLDPELPYPSVVALGVAAAGGAVAGVLLRAQRRGRPGGGGDARSFHLVVWAATPVGAVAGGVGARILDPRDVLVLGAIGALVAAALALAARAPAKTSTAPGGTAPEMP